MTRLVVPTEALFHGKLRGEYICDAFQNVDRKVIPVTVGNSIRLASEVELGDALG